MDNTFNLISKANYLMNSYINLRLQEFGLTDLVSSHGTILMVLLDCEKISMSDLAKRVNKKPQTATTLVNKLVSLNLVSVLKCPNDKRLHYVELTNAGKDLKENFYLISKDLYSKQYTGISQDEVNSFKATLTKIIENL